MRLSVASLRRMIKGKLHVEFVRQELTSYSGLEVLRRYLRQRELPSRLRAACAATGGDYGGGRLALLVLALLYVGARRLEHLRYVAGDPLIARFCGLARIPTARTVANWLRQFTTATLAPLVQLNHELVTEAIARLRLPRLTIDVDGTSAPGPRSRGRFGASTRTIARTPATILCSPIWPRRATSCAARTVRAMSTIPSKRWGSSGR